MDVLLDRVGARILGCLIEKEMTTPEYYPLSLNSLTNACNQKSNRNPVVMYDELTVEQGLETLIKAGLARRTFSGGSRVPKYLHAFLDRFDFSKSEMAVLCELMLRGPQTAGELRTHTDRMSAFENLDAVLNTLAFLSEYDPPLVFLMLRETGRKERRYMHLFSGPAVEEETSKADDMSAASPALGKISLLEAEVSMLRQELYELKSAFAELRNQLGS